MKFLKYTLFAFLGLVLLFFGIGLATPSVDYGHEIIVNKSLKEAWAVSHDESKYDQWLEGFKSMELISGKKGAVGSKYKVIVNPGDGQGDFEMIETVLAKKDYDHITMHFDSEMMDFDQTIFYKETNGKVSIRTESTVSAKGLVLRSMFALMETLGGTFQAQEAKNLEALKVLINENTSNYFGRAKSHSHNHGHDHGHGHSH